MSENLIQLAVTQFSANLELKVQQTVSKLRGRVAEGSHVGKQASPVQYMGPIKMKSPQGRFAPKARVDASFERRWVFPIDKEIDQYIDSFDKLRLISDPTAQYSTNAAASVAREWDDGLLLAATGVATLGTDQAAFSTESFDTTTYGVAATFGSGATGSGLTVAKLVEVKRKFRHYGQDGNPDNEELTIVIGSQQEANLLGETQVTNRDYNGDRPVLVEGSISRFLGFNFIMSERLATDGTNRTVLAFMKSGLYLGVWKDMANEVFKRGDLSGNPWDLNTEMTYGGVRLQKGKLLQILCADTTGASIVP